MSPLDEKCNILALDLFAREAGALVTEPYRTSTPLRIRGHNNEL